MNSPGQTMSSTAHMLIEGYCHDFIRLAASLAQTLEQVSMRKLPLDTSRASLERVQQGMRHLADAIASMLAAEPDPAPPAQPQARQGTAARTGPAGTPRQGRRKAPAASRCTMHGDTSNMPLTSVFQFLSRMRKTGNLVVMLEDEKVSFRIRGGHVINAASNRCQEGERISDLLVEQGAVRERQIAAIVARHEDSDQHLEAALAAAGVVSREQLDEARWAMVQRRMRRAVDTRPAQYAFHEN